MERKVSFSGRHVLSIAIVGAAACMSETVPEDIDCESNSPVEGDLTAPDHHGAVGADRTKTCSSETDENAPSSANFRVAKLAGDYWNERPGDFVGLAEVIEGAGGDAVRFTYPGAGVYDATASATQQAYDLAMSRAASADPTPAAVPVDAFNVGGYWYRVQDSDGEWWTFNGTWNYRDNYIGGLGPDNAAGVAVGGYGSCYREDGDWFWAAAWDGVNHSNLGYRREVDLNSSVWGVRDHVSGFVLYTDHGTLSKSYKRIASCNGSLHGKFYWEHNQGSSSGWSFSVSLSIFSISYNSGGVDRLQKSTGIVWRP